MSNHNLALVLGLFGVSMVLASAFVPRACAQPLPPQLRLEPGDHKVEVDLLPNTVHEENKVKTDVREEIHLTELAPSYLIHGTNRPLP
ncbi:MAG: hypothetical protein WA667_10185 [Candidatus Nitrosopolaris sp.]